MSSSRQRPETHTFRTIEQVRRSLITRAVVIIAVTAVLRLLPISTLDRMLMGLIDLGVPLDLVRALVEFVPWQTMALGIIALLIVCTPALVELLVLHRYRDEVRAEHQRRRRDAPDLRAIPPTVLAPSGRRAAADALGLPWKDDFLQDRRWQSAYDSRMARRLQEIKDAREPVESD